MRRETLRKSNEKGEEKGRGNMTEGAESRGEWKELDKGEGGVERKKK